MSNKKILNVAIGPISHPNANKDRSHMELTCSICSCEFDIGAEGGIDGYIGILPVALCPMCYSGMDEFFTAMHECYDEDAGMYKHQLEDK
jgi:hypothetical protein